MRRWNLGGSALAAATAAVVAIACGPALRADVTVNQTSKFDGVGPRGWGASDGKETLTISGDKMRQESVTHPTGMLLKRFAGDEGFKNATISRIDRKLMYMVDYNDKSYQEWPFESFKEMQQQMSEAMANAPQAQQAPPEKGQAPPLTCQPVKVEAKRTGEKETIAGFPAERALVTGVQSCQNTQTKQTCDVTYTLEEWTTTDLGPLKEVLAFYQKQAEALGLDMRQMQALAQAGKTLISEGTQGFEQVVREMSKIGGYSVRTRFTIEKSGDCGTGSAAGGQDAGDAMKQALKGLFNRKKSGSDDQTDKDKTASGGQGGGKVKVFGMSTEITSVGSASAPADAFEPPSGFKKKEPPKIDKPKKS